MSKKSRSTRSPKASSISLSKVKKTTGLHVRFPAHVVRSSLTAARPIVEDENIDDVFDDEEGAEIPEVDLTKESTPEALETITYRATWKAVIGKDVLGTKSDIFNLDELTFAVLERWAEDVKAKTPSRKLERHRIVTVASYEKAASKDLAPTDVNSVLDLCAVERVLRSFYKAKPNRGLRLDVTFEFTEEVVQTAVITSTPLLSMMNARGQKSATTTQLMNLPGDLEAERLAGNHMPEISFRWPCKNAHCKNNSHTCWVKGNSDLPANHYPISSEIFRSWSHQIMKEKSTVNVPSASIVLKLSKFKSLKEAKTKEEVEQPYATPYSQPPPPYGWSAYQPYAQIPSLPQQFVLQQAATPSHHPPSSPLQSSTDPAEVLESFIEFVKGLRQWASKAELLEQIRRILIDEDWDLEGLRKDISDNVWESFGFKVGTLARLRREIRLFKLQRQEEKD